MHAERAFSRITCRSLFIYIFNTILFMATFTHLISQASGQAYTAPIEATEKSIRPLTDCINQNPRTQLLKLRFEFIVLS